MMLGVGFGGITGSEISDQLYVFSTLAIFPATFVATGVYSM